MADIALVTGASSGIGEETARSLLSVGYVVYVGARRIERMRALADRGAHLIHLDVTVEASMASAVETILKQSGRIDLLVNCAGYGSFGSLEEVPIQEGRQQFEVNVFGLARLIQLVLPTMRAQRSGRVINLSSVGGRFGEPFGSWYHATKFAVEGLSDSLRMELHPFGIRVVVVQPGAIITEWNAIARAGLLKHSGHGDYRQGADRHATLMALADEGLMPSPPSVVAKVIVKAARARRPKTRYAVGGGANVLLFLRSVLSDRAFDATMRMFERRATTPGYAISKFEDVT